MEFRVDGFKSQTFISRIMTGVWSVNSESHLIVSVGYMEAKELFNEPCSGRG